MIDGRSRNGKFLAAARAEFVKHLGGNLTTTQKVMVDRCCWLLLHVALFDERVAETARPLSDRDRKSYLAFSNSLVRATRELGLQPVAAKPPSLEQHLAEIARRSRARAAAD